MMFDSQLRAFRRDNKSPVPGGNRASKLARKAEPEYPTEQVILLLEELSRRIDGLERKDRALADEMRQRARKDHYRRTIIGGCGLAVGTFLIVNSFMHWI
jgi:hypothetical protein